MRRIGSSQLEVSPLCLGTNVLGWTVDEPGAFALLDAFVEAGGNFIDTADAYAQSQPGNLGGESETMIGNWMQARNNRDALVIATKVGEYKKRLGLSAANIKSAVEDSLRRLQTDTIDLYYAHRPDPNTPIEETVAAFSDLVDAGKVRNVAASNFPADLLLRALEIQGHEGRSRFVALQPRYNLVHRAEFEGALAELCAGQGISCVPHSALASGFLTGKYRPDGPAVESARVDRVGRVVATLEESGRDLLSVLDHIAADHGVSPGAVALAWLASRPCVVAPIASARTPQQLADVMGFADLALSPSELALLDSASTEAVALA
jgi:aryl-alcohol dehydrogenase-like predicted oxidoreductase